MPGTRSGQLSPAARREALARMAAEQFDLVVIGGGVTGAGAALDAVTRGLSVALVEARDYSSGTSSRSSKLIHGGLRYLEQMNFALVREALTERSLLLGRLAPHLVKKVPFLFPFNHHVWERLYLGSGLVLYDSIGGASAVPRHRHLTRRQALRLAPALKKEALVGALQYY
ncbi:MAG: FAD-dependent oxidoreductase, partial [Frankiaceae bacterium]